MSLDRTAKKSAMNILLATFVTLLNMANTAPSIKFIQYDENTGEFSLGFGDDALNAIISFKNWRGKSFVEVVNGVSGLLIDMADFFKKDENNV